MNNDFVGQLVADLNLDLNQDDIDNLINEINAPKKEEE